MKKKIIYMIVALLIVTSLIITAIKGLNVDIVYREGVTISISEESGITKEDAQEIASQIWTNGDYVLQRIEFFDDSIMIKVKEASDEQIEELLNKFNEKYSSEKTLADITVEHVSNVKLRSIIEPYILPIGMSTLIILGYYAIRYRGAKQMIIVLKNIIMSEGLLYSIYAICRVGVNALTMPIGLCVYILTIAITTAYLETRKKKEE